MRTLIYGLLLLAFFLPQNIQAQKKTSEGLIGTWTLDYESSFANRETKTKAKFDTIPLQRKARIERSYRGRRMYINADGSYALLLADGRKSEGSWVYNQDTRTLEVTNPNGKVYYQKVKSISATQLVLRPKGLERATMMFPELYYTKN